MNIVKWFFTIINSFKIHFKVNQKVFLILVVRFF